MRLLLSALVILLAGVSSALAYHQFTLGPAIVLARPAHVGALADGKTLVPSGWSASHTLVLTADPRKPAGVDVEIRKVGTKFTGMPTASSTTPSVKVHLGDGLYHWQVRLHNSRGISRWVRSRQPIRVDTVPPSIPHISSNTDPLSGNVYHSSTASFTWQAHDGRSGIAGYSYRLDSDSNGTALTTVRTTQPSVTLNGLTTGQWYLHVRAVDNAGNWGPDATFPVHIDVTPPEPVHVRFNRFQFDPQFNAVSVSFALTRPATRVRIGVYHHGGSLVRLYTLPAMSANTTKTAWWDGKDAHGQDVPEGSYDIYIRAIDQWGHSSLVGWRDFTVNYRKIVVSLSQQRLWAYDGNHLVVTSLVTTGDRLLPTPLGTFEIMAKYSPYKFISPFPKSSPFWYPPSPVSFAMLFKSGGYFIHDSPWRSVYGPGSNSGTAPGTNYGGTHGCVNVPESVMKQLYAWTAIGTAVQVVH